MNRTAGVVLFLTIVVSACGFGVTLPNFFSENYSAIGERIYNSGVGGDGQLIGYSAGPRFGGMMMGNRLSCASCHGEDGRGGAHFMHMDLMQAPDITYQALSGEQDEYEESDGELSHGDAGYEIEDFRQAVVFGSHPNGEPLDNDMPRWQIDADDLVELFAFIKTLP